MPTTVLVHIAGEDPLVGEIEELPTTRDTSVIVHSPRRRDGKDVGYLHGSVISVMYPMHRINFVEVLASPSEEELIGPIRE